MTSQAIREELESQTDRQPSWRRWILLAIGFGCMVGYVRMTSLGFVGYLSQGVAQSTDPWYGLRAAATLASLGVLALSSLFKWFKLGAPAVLATTGAAVASVIILAVDASGTLGPLAAVIGGISCAIIMFIWMLLISAHAVKDIVGMTCVGLFVAGAIVMGVPRIPSDLGFLIAVATAFAAGSAVLLADANLKACVPDGGLPAEQASRIYWPTVVMVAAGGFLATVLYGIAVHLTWLYDWTPNYISFGIAVVAAIGSTFLIMLRSSRWDYFAWIPIVALLLGALGFACFSIRESIQIAVGLMLASVFCAHFLHWPLFSALLSKLDASRPFCAAIALIIVNGSLASMAGDALGAALPHSMQNLGGVAGVMAIALIAVFALSFGLYYRARLARKNLPSEQAASPDDGTEEQPAQSPADALCQRIGELAAEYGLTPRETEIALLTAQGFSGTYIAEQLVVSNSTVRFHQQNLYRKLDVHSRDEFIERTNV